MRAVCLAVVLSLVLQVAVSDPLQTIYGLLNMPTGGRVYRVTKLQELTFNHAITTNPNNWLEYAGLTMVVRVPFDQFVQIYYNIIINSPAPCFLAIRVLVDGNQVKLLKSVSQNQVYHHNRAFVEVLLTKGDHSFKVEYKNDCNFGTIVLLDTSTVIVRVDYLEVQLPKTQ